MHGFEVARKHDERIDCLISARVGERLFCAPANRAVSAGERKWACGGYALNAGDGSQAFFELASCDGAFFRLLEKSIGLNLKREQAMGIEPGIDALQIVESCGP